MLFDLVAPSGETEYDAALPSPALEALGVVFGDTPARFVALEATLVLARRPPVGVLLAEPLAVTGNDGRVRCLGGRILETEPTDPEIEPTDDVGVAAIDVCANVAELGVLGAGCAKAYLS